MQNKDILMKCVRCLQQNSVGQMRLAQDGRTLVCQQCSMIPASHQKTPPGVRLYYRCTACGYKFRKSSTPKLCPYCGKQKVIEDEHVTADKMLRLE